MQWRTEYSVGIEEIDSHHKELLRLFSSIEEMIASGQRWSVIHYRIVEVRQFAQFHFKFEEALMRLFGHPEFEEHAEAHSQILQQVEIVERESLHEDSKEGLLLFFRNWLIGHIQGSDRSYAQHILKGAKVVVPQEFELDPDTANSKKYASLRVVTPLQS